MISGSQKTESLSYLCKTQYNEQNLNKKLYDAHFGCKRNR